MAMATLVPRYTAEEIRHFPDDRLRYEVIRGELFVTPAPGTAHQRAVAELLTTLKAYVERYDLGEAIVSPYEVELADDTAVQPDVLVVLHDRASRITRERLMGPPSLVVEVISYSSKRTDRLQKRALYLDEGVEEYWVVDPDARRVERWIAGQDAPEVLTDRLTWRPRPTAPATVIELEGFFRRVWR
jgi:Uma2 family endonuclease